MPGINGKPSMAFIPMPVPARFPILKTSPPKAMETIRNLPSPCIRLSASCCTGALANVRAFQMVTWAMTSITTDSRITNPKL
ncbi:hypothetical protein FQZ97_1042700 [compost metagenome]